MIRPLATGALAAALLLPLAAAATPPCHQVPEAPAAPAAAAAAGVEVAAVELTDQTGATVRLRELVGDRIAVVDFVYTSCTTICPVLGGIFGGVQQRVGERLGRDVRLISLSIDPERDTPARLRAHADRLGARDGWSWLTGPRTGVERALRGFGVAIGAPADHQPVVLVGDGKTGRWVRFNGFPAPERIVAAVDELLAARAGPGPGKERADAAAR